VSGCLNEGIARPVTPWQCAFRGRVIWRDADEVSEVIGQEFLDGGSPAAERG
jgi:hypothetical protein